MNIFKNPNLSAKTFGFFALIIFIICLFIRMDELKKREIYHLDEVASVMIANTNWINFKAEPNIIYSGAELKERIFWDDGSFGDAISDIKQLWIDNGDWWAHPSLYSMIFRLWNVGFVSIDNKEVLNRGVALNFIFFGCSFFIAFLIARRFNNDFYSGFLGLLWLALAFVNPASVTNTLFMRPYALQELSFWLLVFILLIYFSPKHNTTQHNTTQHNTTQHNTTQPRAFKQILSLILATTICFSSGYFGLIFAGFLFIFYSFYLKRYFLFIGIYLAGLLISSIICLTYYLALLGGRGLEAAYNLSSYLKTIPTICAQYIEVLGAFLGIIPLILIIFGFLLFRKIQDRNLAFIALIALISSFAIFFIAPIKTLRYIMPLFPFILLFIPLLGLYFKKAILKKLFLIAIFVSFIVMPKEIYFGMSNFPQKIESKPIIINANLHPFLLHLLPKENSYIFIFDCIYPYPIENYLLFKDNNDCYIPPHKSKEELYYFGYPDWFKKYNLYEF